MNKITSIGYSHGRFQPFHKGHLPILLYILKNYDELWVGISNPLRKLPDNIDTYAPKLKQSILLARQANKNIFSFVSRRAMILASLKDKKIDLRRVTILPHFGFYEEKNWADFFPPKDRTTIVLHCKDPHHQAKLAQYQKTGWKTKTLPLLRKGFSGTKFHKKYPNGNWQTLVPDGTRRVIEKTSKS